GGRPRGGGVDARARAGAPAPALDPGNEALFAALVAWRRAAAQGKPAYTVAHNATLRAIAGARPGSEAALEAIGGVGPAFVARHAVAVLELVGAHGG
ncbi:MAG: HRDC domain-containing protein, partial [Solirubrobacteraceae bacterium]